MEWVDCLFISDMAFRRVTGIEGVFLQAAVAVLNCFDSID